MIHPGLAALEKWDTIEYAAGYRARLAAIPDSETAHHCWRCGWEDADTEALELDRHQRVLADGREDDYAETWGLLFDAGGDASANGSSVRWGPYATLERRLDLHGHQCWAGRH
jgi:hypothetical protein